MYAHFFKIRGKGQLIISRTPEIHTEIQRYEVAGLREAKKMVSKDATITAWNF